MSSNTRRRWLCQYCGAYRRQYIQHKEKHCLELKKLQNLLDHTPYGYRNNQYNFRNKEINKRFLKEYPTPEKLMKYNAYDQKLIMKNFVYSFVLASPNVAKLQPDRGVSQAHRNELARYQEYLDLEPE